MAAEIWKRTLSYGQSGVISSLEKTSYGSGRIGVTFNYCLSVH